MRSEVGREEIPHDLAGLVVSLGEAEWGATAAASADEHAAMVATSVRLTAEHFVQTESQQMHGLYLAGSGIVLCHTGTSPNSPDVARALTGAWNRLVEDCRAALGAAPASPSHAGDKGPGRDPK